MVNERAGKPAEERDLIDVGEVVDAYYNVVPDSDVPSQRVEFGTSGHRGSSLNAAFNEAHIVAISQAIYEYRKLHNIDGKLYIGFDTHVLSIPAYKSAIEVLVPAGVDVFVDSRDSWTPTPAVSLAIIEANRDKNGDILPDALLQPDWNGKGLSDGIVITPSHNPPADGGFKYNPPNGGPADSETTMWIQNRANEIIKQGYKNVKRVPFEQAINADNVHRHDFRKQYVDELKTIIDLDVVRNSGAKFAVDPLGGASVEYWPLIAETYGIDLTILNDKTDPRFSFMTIDWDGKVRMDCSSPYCMASVVNKIKGSSEFTLAVGNDTDADRHGIVTPDAGLMNPNHYLTSCIKYLFGEARPAWGKDFLVGKTIVSSRMIEKVAAKLGRTLFETPVGFKWFVDGLMQSKLGFSGEESAGGTFLRRDARLWTTDKDGILLDLLAFEIVAVTGETPSNIYAECEQEFGKSYFERIDSPATLEQKAAMKKIRPEDVTATELAGEKIERIQTKTPANNGEIGGLYVGTKNAWFAARPSGTENVCKFYAESFISEAHLHELQKEAQGLVDEITEV
jgi:phosphoglucomutase